MSTTYDAELNIIQTLASTAQGPASLGVTQPLTDAALNAVIDPQGAPNAFGTTGGPKTAAFSVLVTNGSGQACARISNPS